MLEISWEYVLAIVIAVVYGAAWIAGKATEAGFLALIGLLFTFVTGRYAVGLAMQMRS